LQAPAARRISCSRLSRSSSSHPPAAGSMHAVLSEAAITQYIEQHCHDADSDSEAGSADIFSSCSTSSSTSDFSSFDGSSGSKASTGSSACSGVAWQGVMNWSAVFEASGVRASSTQQGAGATCLHHKLSSPDRLRKPSTRATTEERQRRAEQLRAAMAEERLARLKQEQVAKQQRRAAGKVRQPCFAVACLNHNAAGRCGQHPSCMSDALHWCLLSGCPVSPVLYCCLVALPQRWRLC
jgi:hypothetical protein